MSERPVFFISGKHPIREIGGFGHSTYVRTHARAATAAGYTPQLFCIADHDDEELEDFGTIHLLASSLAARQSALLVHGPRLADAIIERALRRPDNEPIIIHGFGAWSYAGAIALQRLRSVGRNAVLIASSYTTHLDESWYMLAGWRAHDGLRRRASLAAQYAWSGLVIHRLEQRGYRAATIVTANYACVARMLKARHGPLDVRIARYSSDAAFTATVLPSVERAANDVPRIVSVSGHFERKGVDVLLRACAILRDQGLRFQADIVGGGALLEVHRTLTRNLHLGDSVTIHGVVPTVAPYLAAADIYVLPSRSEQSGALSMLEALEQGLPVVASDCDGIPEDLAGTDAGLLVAPGDAEDLARSLARLIADPAERALRASAARALFEERFSPAAFVADIGRIYADATSR